jgi:hypothetical protein
MPATTPFPLIDARTGIGTQTIEASTSERKYWLIPFSAPHDASDSAYNYGLKLEAVSRAPATSTRIDTAVSIPGAEALVRRVRAESSRRTADALQIDEAIRSMRSNPERFHRSFSTRRTTPVSRALPQTIDISSPFSGEEGTTLTGNLRVSSSNTAIYVDSRVDGTVLRTDLEAMMQGFDGISLPRLHTLFGTESDVDGNGVIDIFLAAPEKIGSDVIGFFRPADLLPDGVVSGVHSNFREIIYVRTPGAGFDFSLAQATVAHEAFHLINFAEKSLPLFQSTGGTLGTVEALFLNEGLAHLAEDLVGWGVGTPPLTKIYLQCVGQTSLGGGGTTSGDPNCRIVAPGNDSIARRGAAMLFLLYMFQQLGGANYSTTDPAGITGEGLKFLQALCHSGKSGIANLEESSARPLFSWYADFAGLLALDNSGTTSDPRYNFAAEQKDSYTGLFRNIRLRGTRGSGQEAITLNGPIASREVILGTDLSVDSALFVSGAQTILLTIPANLEAHFSLTAAAALSLGVAIVPAP